MVSFCSALLVTDLLSRPMSNRAKGMLTHLNSCLHYFLISFKLGVQKKVVTAPHPHSLGALALKKKNTRTGIGYQNNMRRSRCLGQSGQEALEFDFLPWAMYVFNVIPCSD